MGRAEVRRLNPGTRGGPQGQSAAAEAPLGKICWPPQVSVLLLEGEIVVRLLGRDWNQTGCSEAVRRDGLARGQSRDAAATPAEQHSASRKAHAAKRRRVGETKDRGRLP